MATKGLLFSQPKTRTDRETSSQLLPSTLAQMRACSWLTGESRLTNARSSRHASWPARRWRASAVCDRSESEQSRMPTPSLRRLASSASGEAVHHGQHRLTCR